MCFIYKTQLELGLLSCDNTGGEVERQPGPEYGSDKWEGSEAESGLFGS